MIGAGAVGVAVLVDRRATVGRLLRGGLHTLDRRMRYWGGHLEGLRYRLAGRGPDLDVSDDVLADRIRSTLGRIEKRLDVPRIHVMVEDHVALLHGDLPSNDDALMIERAVAEMPGVRGVESYLHVGLISGDTRPSQGRARAIRQPSPMMRELIDAARAAGATDDEARPAVRAVLATFADRIPYDERAQLLSHVPEDVREIADPPRRLGTPVSRVRTISELVGAINAQAGIGDVHIPAITETVLAHLRRHVPEEAADVAAVLPDELRVLWLSAVPG